MSVFAKIAEFARPTEDLKLIRECLRREVSAPWSITPEENKVYNEATARHQAQVKELPALLFGVVAFKEAIKERPFQLADYLVFAWVACLLLAFGLGVAQSFKGPEHLAAQAQGK